MTKSPSSTVELEEFSIRYMVTARVAGYVTVEAESHEQAIEIAAFLQPSDAAFEVDEDFYIDGDETAFVNDGDTSDGVEVDMRLMGEPLSWDCVNLVKDLAKLTGFDPTDANTGQLLIEYAERARGLLKTNEAAN